MKNLVVAIFLFLFSSCTRTYYQVYTASSEKGVVKNNSIVFEDENCSIEYDLWGEDGDLSFIIFNKSEKDLTILTPKSFFVQNNEAFAYYQNRTVSTTNVEGVSIGSYLPYIYPSLNAFGIKNYSFTKQTQSTTTFIEKSEVVIPPHTYIRFSGFKINGSRFVSCDLPKYPQNNMAKVLFFSKENSPLVFSNLITYSIENENYRIKNEFFVSEIANYTSGDMFKYVENSICGKVQEMPLKVFKNNGPNKFYIIYTN